MKTAKKFFLTLAIILTANILFGQTAVKQYCNGNKGSVNNPINALGNDLSDCSTLKLRSDLPSLESHYISQNFIFESQADNNYRIAFVVQLEKKLTKGDEKMLNLKFYTLLSGKANADSLSATDVKITKINESLNLYEFSFVSKEIFDEAGIMLHGAGDYRKIKIYKVYLAINNDNVKSSKVIARQ